MKKKFIFLLAWCLLHTSCQPGKHSPAVRIRLPVDPQSLNPVSYPNSYALQIVGLMFQSLLTIDLADGKLKPALVESLPYVKRQDSLTLLTYRLRKEAVWDNGQPITPRDVAFTLKVLQCPLVNNERQRPRFDFIKDIRIDLSNARQFTLVCQGYQPEMALSSGDFFVLPAYLFDRKGILEKFSLPDIIHHFDSLTAHPDIKQFAESFNSVRYTRDKAFLRGSGGYTLKEWKGGQSIQLEKKTHWWGDALKLDYLTAHPAAIRFLVIPDNTTATIALRNGQIDVFDNMPVADFNRLRQSPPTKDQFRWYTPPTYRFVYLGINSRLTKFADPRTRRALAHLLDVPAIIQATQQGYAVPTVGLISPADPSFYNRNIRPYQYDTTQAVRLLKEAGWQRQERKWMKMIKEEVISLTINLQYKAGDTEYENLATIFQQSAATIGIPVEIEPVEGGILATRLREQQFEGFIRSLTGNPFVYNFEPILHSRSASVGGSNYTGFGTAESDSLIDAINHAAEGPAKVLLIQRLQEVLHQESTILFLYFLQNRLAINARFTNLKVSGLQPGYDVSAFQAQ